MDHPEVGSCVCVFFLFLFLISFYDSSCRHLPRLTARVPVLPRDLKVFFPLLFFFSLIFFFQVFVNCREICNSYTELNNPVIQRWTFLVLALVCLFGFFVHFCFVSLVF